MGILILTPELEAQVPEHLRLQGGRMGCPFHGSTKGAASLFSQMGGFIAISAKSWGDARKP
jgi:hypothetical protein